MTKEKWLKMLKNHTKNELVAVLYAYDKYIQDANDIDLYKTGWRPVCVDEYINNDARELVDWDRLINQIKNL